MRSILAMLVCAVLIAAAVTGCGRSKTVKTPGGTATVTEKGDETTVTFRGEDGEGTFEFGSEVNVSEEEIGIPFYPGAKTAHMGQMTQTGEDQEQFIQVYLTTPDSVDKVKAFYQEKLPGAKTPMEMTTGDSRMIQMVVEEGDTMKSVVITRDNDDEETQIGLMRADKPE